MGKIFNSLDEKHIEFIKKQKMFFVATSNDSGHINLSPKGLDSFRVLNNNLVVWLNYTGSGNETAAHLEKSSRMTIMFCAFEGEPLIMRLYGQARAIHEWDFDWPIFSNHFIELHGARQIIELDIEMLQTSCGYGVPLYDYKGDRDDLKKWLDNKSEDQIKEYWFEKNMKSIDGELTGMQNLPS
jgi:hypothetical protein